jgi:phasin
MADAPKMPFEVPAEMIALAEQSFDQARRAFDQFVNAAHTTITTVEGQNKAVQAGAREIADKVMSFAEQNVANAFTYAQRLVHVRDPQELLQLHSQYVQEQMKALSDQAKAVTETAGKAASDFTRPRS